MSPVIYTRTGDHGDTSLACGKRLPKDDLRIEAYGSIDELSSALGVVSALFHKLNKREHHRWAAQEALIEWIQDKLFTLSSMIATVNLPAGNLPEVSEADIKILEDHIDEMEQQLPELRNFILPGGSELVSFIHLARTICRRAERICTTLDREIPLNPLILPFMNRLSDELFVLARWVSHTRGEAEKIWVGRKRPENRRRGRIRTTQRDLALKLLPESEPDGQQLTLFETKST
jgi:cob(I)alamin adenosyltransferase